MWGAGGRVHVYLCGYARVVADFISRLSHHHHHHNKHRTLGPAASSASAATTEGRPPTPFGALLPSNDPLSLSPSPHAHSYSTTTAAMTPGLVGAGAASAALLQAFDHVVWSGDLNWR